jgi:alginate O-acetyltransferase complex protein AlgI
MIFASLNFLFLFFPLFLGAYFAFPGRSYRNFVLFIFSLVFYAWGEPVYVFVMIFSVLMNYAVALWMDAGGAGRRPALVIGVMSNLVLLGVFKYLDFFVGNINGLLGTRIPPLGLPLPIGVSFYTFQLISYIVDVHAGRSRAQKSFVLLGAYLAGFPQLVAGPIVRYQTIAGELLHRRENMADFVMGTRRFIVGLAKKVIIANNMAFVVDAILKQLPENYGMSGAWIVLAAYALQIYYDFSGYSDMAIGMGRMLGFHYLENFNYPYIARSVTEFWRRWHMSLTSFFRDYVYIPMGGNRVSLGLWIRNILFIWALTGLWHGAKWNYVLWGLYYGIILILEKLVTGKVLQKLPAVVAHLYVGIVVLVGWALFRIEDLTMLKGFLGTLVGTHGPGALATFVYSETMQAHFIIIFMVGVVFCAPLAPWMERAFYKTAWGSWVADLWLLILFAVSIALLVAGMYNPFIYFRF